MLMKRPLHGVLGALGLSLIVGGSVLVPTNLAIGLAACALGVSGLLASLMLALFTNLRQHLTLLERQTLALHSAIALIRLPLRRPAFFLRHAVAPDFVELCAEVIRRGKVRRVLELGCGVSSLHLALLLPDRQEGGRLVCLEDDPEWVDIMNAELHQLTTSEGAAASVMHAPLQRVSGNGLVFYSAGEQLKEEKPFDLVVVDGPSDVRLRGQVFEGLKQLMHGGTILIFDDGDQEAIGAAVRSLTIKDASWNTRYYPTVKGTWVVWNGQVFSNLPLP